MTRVDILNLPAARHGRAGTAGQARHGTAGQSRHGRAGRNGSALIEMG